MPPADVKLKLDFNYIVMNQITISGSIVGNRSEIEVTLYKETIILNRKCFSFVPIIMYTQWSKLLSLISSPKHFKFLKKAVHISDVL